MTYLSYLAENMKTYKFRMDFFPSTFKQSSCLVDSDIPGICDFIDKETEETGEEGIEGWSEDVDLLGINLELLNRNPKAVNLILQICKLACLMDITQILADIIRV